MTELTYRRVHRASPQTLFDCMTRPEHLTRFWGPTGTTTPIDGIVVDLRPGGAFETLMVNDADGSTYLMRAVYVEVRRPDLLVWTDPASGMTTWITFTDLGDGSTEVVTHQTDVPPAFATPAALAGFETSLDRFDSYLASLREPVTASLTSADGTTIGYERSGAGPAVVLVDGAMCHRAGGPMRPLARLLSSDFTVYAYDRRGRGDSGDTLPYAVDREIEDLRAVVDAAGGHAHLYGMSSGGGLILRAVAAGVPADRIALYEPPYVAGSTPLLATGEYRRELDAALAAGDRSRAVELFLTLVGVPAPVIAGMRQGPGWPAMTAMAHALAYDDRVMGDSQVPHALAATVTVPALVVDGESSPQWLRDAAKTTAAALPDGRYESLPEQTHDVSPEALAPVLTRFLLG